MRVWEESPFHEGDELPVAVWQSILDRSAIVQVRGQAISLLARSEHSRFLLTQKLLQRDLPVDIIRSVLDDLERDGALSDRRYAESWVRSRLSGHPEDPRHMVARLRERGIAGDLAAAAVESVMRDDGTDEAGLAREYAERLTRRRALSGEQIVDKLVRRGFSHRVARSVAADAASDDSASDDPGLR